MPVHIEELTTEVAVLDGDLPLSEAQVERLVALVCARLSQKERAAQQQREATALRRSAAPPLSVGGGR
jgi:hypothetical protein